ncbi:PaaI family thioesterase [Pseudohoeflea coraliihabitans]|uniref:PaaI family thioesterase n=1 Tax=Pseudohoeflea coraliihabitans TaxID=2860393 RepID=A0ABS6WNL0_9HYPH|nr:PaaI family thioesterase [Pseudohoeflea sp. DP4N28-3]MBW3097248.1 PaaI family thioesterase [Pseudohoeflea sp. DP4N28-3]
MLTDRLREEMTRPPFNEWLGPVAIEADEVEKRIAVELPFRPEFSHQTGATVFHGGVIAALADITGHAAVAVFHGAVTPTISLSTEFLAPAIGDRLRAVGRLRKKGRTIARADVDLFVGDRLVALARGTFSTKG